MTPYISVEELRKPPFNLHESQLDGTQAKFLQDFTQEFIHDTCKQDFFKEGSTGSEVEKRHSGTGKFILFVDKRLISLKEIKVYAGNEASFTTWGEENFIVKPRYIEWKQLNTASGASRRLRLEEFAVGTGNIGVVGIWGYETVPTQIKYLQGRMIQKIVRDGFLAEKNQSEGVGDFSAAKMVLESLLTGDNELDLIIRKFRDFQIHVPS